MSPTTATKLSAADVCDALAAATHFFVPPWHHPLPPSEFRLFWHRGRALSVEWTADDERVRAVTEFEAPALRPWLEKFARYGFEASSLRPRAELPAALPPRAEAFLERRAALRDALQADPDLGFAVDAARTLRCGPVAGFELLTVLPAGLYERRPREGDFVKWDLEAGMVFAPEGSATPLDPTLRALLQRGDEAYPAARERLRSGTAGWKIHTDLLVVELPSGFYNTRFAGDLAASYTKFQDAGVSNTLADLLTRATLGTVDAKCHPVSPAQRASLAALVARQERPVDELLAALEAGALSLGGGGPTSEDQWTLAFANGRFEQRDAYGEARERSRDEVRALLEARRYHSVYGG